VLGTRRRYIIRSDSTAAWMKWRLCDLKDFFANKKSAH
jgi:hypothetical protein